MSACPQCGEDNVANARFCHACGSSLATDPERRKLATILFCDVAGSTALGERSDAESVRDVMSLYFGEMRAAIERHGGTVEKFIGDAVMAVFGIPVAHEDDALRAVRAADEMHARLADLNVELERRYASPISLRIGVNTGEVVAGAAGTRQALVTGDAVNVAARLEAAAAAGEVLIGDATHRLVRDAVSVERVEPLALKGKTEPVIAYRLVSVERAGPARTRRLDTPMVGRDAQLDRLRPLLEEAAGGRCRLATIIGEPGVGKSRLAVELLRDTGAYKVLTGRCLEYGEGITYWPIGEIVRQAAGIRDDDTRDEAVNRIASIVSPAVAAVVGQAIGLADGGASTRDIASAIQDLLVALAGPRPLFVLVDDIHWAEPPLLELLASLPSRMPDVPVMILCLARPELLDKDPGWTASVRLEPLDESETGALAAQLLGGAALPAGLVDRISTAAAGNPLFVEELIGMLVEEGLLTSDVAGWVADPDLAGFAIPATLRGLLGARLDALSAGERSALERGAVEGQVFHRGAVTALSDGGHRLTVDDDLDGLSDREHLRTTRPDFVDETAYRIRHILIRDAAYEAIPKRARAALHQRYAEWLEPKAGERVTEYEEILGHHLERTYRYLEELGPTGPEGEEIAGRAAGWLERAGRRAFNRRDSRAAVHLLSRAADLMPPESTQRLEVLQAVGEEQSFMMELDAASRSFGEVIDGASARSDDRLRMYGRLWLSLVRFWGEPEFGALEMLDEVEAAARVFEELGDLKGLARVHDWRSFVLSQLGRYAESATEARVALDLGERLEDRRFAQEQTWYLAWAAAYGPTPVADGIAACEAIIAAAGDDPAVKGHALYSVSLLHAFAGRFDVARDLADRGLASFEGLGMVFTAWHPLHRGMIDLLSGEADGAERHLRGAIELLAPLNDFPSASTAASLLADLLVDVDRVDDGAELVALAREWAPRDQPIQAARWQAAQARILVRRGAAAAEGLARDAVDLAARTDHLILQGDAHIALADVLRRTGADADAVIATGMDRYRARAATAAETLGRRRLHLE